MLSGEGMQRRKMVKNNYRSNLPKSNFARAAHFFRTFLYLCLCTTSTWNFQKLLSYTFYEGNFHFFSLPLIFTLHWWPLAFLILSPPLKNFHVVLPTNRYLLRFFISSSKSLSLFFSLSFGSPLSLFLCLSLALYSKFVDMTIYLSLII